MNVVLISQCSKQALPATRRILDQFAERKGSRTWLTPITEVGLETLHGLLRRGARKNTAVACHIVRGGEMELLWIVGNRRRFDPRGNVPTNTTSRRVLDRYRERGWRHSESIALLAAIAGLFHDFGKANALFAAKLIDSRAPRSEPWRHEWLSVRLFEAFIGEDDDAGWLARLRDMPSTAGDFSLDGIVADKRDSKRHNPLKRQENRPLACAVVWLICTHHRLPLPRRDSDEPHHAIRATNADRWTDMLGPGWVTPSRKESVSDWENLWSFPVGLPSASRTWREAAAMVGRRAVRHAELTVENWMQRPLALHAARCALMLSDHLYSSGPAHSKWQDASYAAYANTEWIDDEEGVRRNVPKQKLDEHCIGVSRQAYLIAKSLPSLRSALPAIGNVKSLRRRSSGRFSWQNQAFSLARQTAESSRRQGGFFVNMASTGTGKTLANARMAFGLSTPDEGCRFTVLLGLRTLTLQTADALRERIGLSDSDLAVLVGSAAVRELHERRRDEAGDEEAVASNDGGSESSRPLFAEHEYVRYDGELDESRIGRWLAKTGRDRRLHRLVSAPVAVGTIDHLMPATESARGGHQIAPMLRLLTSDLVLDEPDEFDLSDQPALCRLVHWAGLLGSRVVLSSATLPPALLETLFDAYSHGRQQFNEATEGRERPIVCGWVDEFRTIREEIADTATFGAVNAQFVERRLSRVEKAEPSRRSARLVPVEAEAASAPEAIATIVLDEAKTLHALHGETSPNGRHRVSVGIVRMANIDPLVRVARAMAAAGCADMDIHLCIYHARHPLYRRAAMERVLDDLLARHEPALFWTRPSVMEACRRDKRDQVFLVLATAVAEVGRDHCYDWAIVEPSSMRSIVQLVGRVLRHRWDRTPEAPNVVLLRRNIKSLEGRDQAFMRPGYESRDLSLNSHDLEDVLAPDHYRHPGAASRLREPDEPAPSTSLVDLEHVAMRRALDGEPSAQTYPANLWWKCATWWCYALQARTRFRAGEPTDMHALVVEDAGDDPTFEHFTEGDWISSDLVKMLSEPVETADGIVPWPRLDDATLFNALDERYERPLVELCRRYLSVSLRQPGATDVWSYHWWLGIHHVPRN